MAPRCTLISTLGAISTVAYCSVELGDLADDAAGGDDLVALLQRSSIARGFLRALLLRTDQQEIEHDEDRDHRQERHAANRRRATAPAAWAYAGLINTGIPPDGAACAVAIRRRSRLREAMFERAGGSCAAAQASESTAYSSMRRARAWNARDVRRQGVRRDRRAQPGHQLEVVVQVVDRGEARAEDLVHALQVMQVGAA